MCVSSLDLLLIVTVLGFGSHVATVTQAAFCDVSPVSCRCWGPFRLPAGPPPPAVC